MRLCAALLFGVSSLGSIWGLLTAPLMVFGELWSAGGELRGGRSPEVCPLWGGETQRAPGGQGRCARDVCAGPADVPRS